MAKKYVYSCIDRANITGTVDAVEENTPFITDKFVNLIHSGWYRRIQPDGWQKE